MPANANILFVPFKDAHPEKILELIMDTKESVAPWIDWVNFVNTLEDIEVVKRYFIDQTNAGNGQTFVISLNDNYVGAIGLYQIDKIHSTARLGFWLGRQYEGRGIMKTAIRSIMAYSLRELHIRQVSVEYFADNMKCHLLTRKLGLRNYGNGK